MITETEIFAQMKPLIVEVLGVAEEQIHLESVLVKDLGAESIDLLDLSFRIEEHFKVRIEAYEIEREARKRLPDGVYEKDGFLTEAALLEIQRAAPELNPSKLVIGLRKTDIPLLLTVGFFVRTVARKLTDKTQGGAHA